MYFKSVLGNSNVKRLLLQECENNRIPHAQLFFGEESSQQLPMAMAFAMYLFCKNKSDEDSCGKCSGCTKMFKLMHPDLHFFYPTIKTQKGEEKISESKKSFPEFKKIVLEHPQLDIEDWERGLGSAKKPSIRSADLSTICELSGLRAYEGGYKVFIIWSAEKIAKKSSSILLKTLEEPSAKTIFILICNNPDALLSTIQSRLQIKQFKKIKDSILFGHLREKYPDFDEKVITNSITEYNNSYHSIINRLNNSEAKDEIINEFIYWIRLCFLSTTKNSKCMNPKTKKTESVIAQLVDWCSFMNTLEKVSQIKFVSVGSVIFRHAFLLNYSVNYSLGPKVENSDFDINSFSKYVQHYNISEIFSLLSNAHYYLARYANSKILFLDLSFSLGKLLHKKN